MDNEFLFQFSEEITTFSESLVLKFMTKEKIKSSIIHCRASLFIGMSILPCEWVSYENFIDLYYFTAFEFWNVVVKLLYCLLDAPVGSDLISKKQEIGRGGSGIVFTTNNKKVVAKQYIYELDSELIRDLYISFRVQKFSHTPKIFGLQIDKYCHVKLFMENGGQCLYDLLFPISRISLKDARIHIYSILQLLSKIHGEKICHRDLSSKNIFVDEKCQVMVGDWGSATFIGGKETYQTEQMCTIWCRAPELFLEERYDCSSDMWSLGILMLHYVSCDVIINNSTYDCICRIFSFFGKPDKQHSLHSAYGHDRFKDVETEKDIVNHCVQKYWGVEGFDLLYKLLQTDPKKRISAKEALHHKFFLMQLKSNSNKTKKC